MLECVVNVSEGRDADVLDALAAAAGRSLLDVHADPDHHRCVLTLAGPGPVDALAAARDVAGVAAERVDLRRHAGVHPRLGALDVVPFVALDDDPAVAVDAADEFARWWARDHGVPVFRYDLADPRRRSLPDTRREAFAPRHPDLGPDAPHPRLGATAVGARAPLVALNCRLATDDLGLARRIAATVRERDGGLPGVRALGLALASRGRAQVSMNLVALERTGPEAACGRVRELARAAGSDVEVVELVGLVPAAAIAGADPGFLAWSGLGPHVTIEARLAARAPAAGPPSDPPADGGAPPGG